MNDPIDCPLLNALLRRALSSFVAPALVSFAVIPLRISVAPLCLTFTLPVTVNSWTLWPASFTDTCPLPLAGRVNVTDFIATDRFPRTMCSTPFRLSVPVALAKFHLPELSGRA